MLVIAALWSLNGASMVGAEDAVPLAITMKDHKFDPNELHAPAGKPLAVRVKNLDAIAAEFESAELHVEKIVTPDGEGMVYIRPQKPGRYNFFDDFHHDTTGVLVVE